MTDHMTIASLYLHDKAWRGLLEKKGYINTRIKWEIEPVNDVMSITMYFDDREYSTTWVPSELRTMTREELNARLDDITVWVNDLPDEHVTRDENLVKEYEDVKARIERSNLAEIIKVEAATLMEMLKSAVLPAPKGDT